MWRISALKGLWRISAFPQLLPYVTELSVPETAKYVDPATGQAARQTCTASKLVAAADTLHPRLSYRSSTRKRARVPGSAADPYTLTDLQGYLNQFPPSHYSHGGREPLLFAIVLLLSLQPRGLLAFLAQARPQHCVEFVCLIQLLWFLQRLVSQCCTPSYCCCCCCACSRTACGPF